MLSDQLRNRCRLPPFLCISARVCVPLSLCVCMMQISFMLFKLLLKATCGYFLKPGGHSLYVNQTCGRAKEVLILCHGLKHPFFVIGGLQQCSVTPKQYCCKIEQGFISILQISSKFSVALHVMPC
jgi:ABC-type uncharacterized transport system permease subunit